MHRSHPITVAGQFVGAAVTHGGGLRFVAIDPRVEELDHSLWGTLAEVERVVQHLVRTGDLPRRAAGIGQREASWQ